MELTNPSSAKMNFILQHNMKDDRYRNEQEHPLLIKIDEAFKELINMKDVKDTLKEISALLWVNEQRKLNGLQTNTQVLHMLFTGNPGTGKTTVARKLAEIFFEWNFLSKGHFIEVERADLVGEYIGQTAQKTRTIIEKAKGGILFIDEAYSLSRGGEKDFGKEAIDTLVTHMENNYEDFILILAGYPKEMEFFMQLNPGLRSRFPFIIHFKDFTEEELIGVAKQFLKARQYSLTVGAERKFRKYIQLKLKEKTADFANARFVRNTIEDAIRKHAIRLLKKHSITTEELIFIATEDIHFD